MWGRRGGLGLVSRVVRFVRENINLQQVPVNFLWETASVRFVQENINLQQVPVKFW